MGLAPTRIGQIPRDAAVARCLSQFFDALQASCASTGSLSHPSDRQKFTSPNSWSFRPRSARSS